MKHIVHLTAETISEAAECAKQGSKLIAGGTDLLGVLKDRILPEYPEQVIDIKALPGMDRIEEKEDRYLPTDKAIAFTTYIKNTIL